MCLVPSCMKLVRNQRAIDDKNPVLSFLFLSNALLHNTKELKLTPVLSIKMEFFRFLNVSRSRIGVTVSTICLHQQFSSQDFQLILCKLLDLQPEVGKVLTSILQFPLAYNMWLWVIHCLFFFFFKLPQNDKIYFPLYLFYSNLKSEDV